VSEMGGHGLLLLRGVRVGHRSRRGLRCCVGCSLSFQLNASRLNWHCFPFLAISSGFFVGLLYRFPLLRSLSPTLAKRVYVFRWLPSTKRRLLSQCSSPNLNSGSFEHRTLLHTGAPLLRTQHRRQRRLHARAILFRIEVWSMQNRNLEYLAAAMPLSMKHASYALSPV
jgi:hypothetical protein